ncbi:MAG: Fpg/Nei family DNA glycosylase [Candidatus Omnitrophica bacterium]|nr:Fpg/Nei family DNA glycosylase [Candidatus Omnitrophota bacterium]
MPELPDVEVFRRYLKRTSLHKKIKDVEVDRKRILKGITEPKFRKKLKNDEFKTADRRGKYLFVKLKKGDWLVVHFGMTGFFRYYKDPGAEPGHPRARFRFANGYTLAFDNRRLLGRIQYAGSMDEYIRKQKLGPDALEVDFETFSDALGRGRSTAKQALMSQKYLAGIGNIYSDEILFQAGVLPKKKVSRLTEEEKKNVFQKMKYVLEKSVQYKADPAQMPRTWLIPARGKGGRCPRCGGRIQKGKIGGRSGYWCAECQQ